MSFEKPDDGGFSRRRFLEAGSIAAAVAFGGSTQVAGRFEGSEAIDATQPMDSDFTASMGIQNPDINFNEFNFTNYSWDLTEMLHDPLVKWHPEREEYVPMILEDWNLGEQKMTMTISDEYAWHNGDELTAEDVATSLQLEIWFGFSVSEYASAANATGENTVELDLREQFNEQVLEHELFGGTWVNKPPHVYEEWIGRFEDASGEEEMKSVQEELAQWELDEPFGNGPFEVDSMNEQRMKLVPHDGHPASDAINFDSYTLEYITTNQNVWQAMRSGNIDGIPSVFAPREVVDSFPDHVIQTLHASYNGFGIHFNHDHPHFGNRAVRQAIAHVVDRQQVAQNSGANTKTPVEVVNGLPPSTQDEWFGDSSVFDAYEPDPQRAAELLQDAGYQRQGNVWQNADGPIEANLITRADFSDWVTAAQTVASQLTNFGMNVQLQTMEGPTFDETFQKGNFDLAGGGWGSGPYPLFSFENFYDEEARSAIHYPESVTVPEVGSDSGELTVNFPEMLSTLTRSAENDEAKFRQLAWAFNQDLPVLPIQEKQDQSFISTDAWAVPPKDDPAMSVPTPPFWLPKVGKLQARQG